MRRHLGFLSIAAAWAVLSCPAQTKPAANPAPCTVAPQPDPCGTSPAPAANSGPAEKFPFPGESGSASPSLPDSPASPAVSGVPDAPGTPAAPTAPTAKKDFPFPGDAAGSGNKDTADTTSSGSGSSSSSSGDTPQFDPNAAPGAPGLIDKGSEGEPAQPGRHILHRVNPIGTKLQSADEREDEDLSVAHFYMQTGDLKGAYLRSQDAVKTVPDDPGAHFLLAEVALKLNKRDEAIAEYNACLKLDPVPDQAKDARKALARLKP